MIPLQNQRVKFLSYFYAGMDVLRKALPIENYLSSILNEELVSVSLSIEKSLPLLPMRQYHTLPFSNFISPTNYLASVFSLFAQYLTQPMHSSYRRLVPSLLPNSQVNFIFWRAERAGSWLRWKMWALTRWNMMPRFTLVEVLGSSIYSLAISLYRESTGFVNMPDSIIQTLHHKSSKSSNVRFWDFFIPRRFRLVSFSCSGFSPSTNCSLLVFLNWVSIDGEKILFMTCCTLSSGLSICFFSSPSSMMKVLSDLSDLSDFSDFSSEDEKLSLSYLLTFFGGGWEAILTNMASRFAFDYKNEGILFSGSGSCFSTGSVLRWALSSP